MARNFDWLDCYRSVSGENGQRWHVLNFKTLSNAKKGGEKKSSRPAVMTLSPSGGGRGENQADCRSNQSVCDG